MLRRLVGCWYWRSAALLPVRRCANGSRSWQPIYRFRWIPIASAVSKVKIVQTAVTVLLAPGCIVAYVQDELSFSSMCAVVCVSAFALFMLYVMSFALRRTIGVVSVDKAVSTVRIGYLDFWGNRRNVVVPVRDLVPLTDVSIHEADFYVPVKRFSQHQFLLYLPIKRCDIVDREKFIRVFGQLV